MHLKAVDVSVSVSGISGGSKRAALAVSTGTTTKDSGDGGTHSVEEPGGWSEGLGQRRRTGLTPPGGDWASKNKLVTNVRIVLPGRTGRGHARPISIRSLAMFR